MIRASKYCPHCGDTHTKPIDATLEQYYDWCAGRLIQDAMPQLSPYEREFLISGYCFECQDHIFAEEE